VQQEWTGSICYWIAAGLGGVHLLLVFSMIRRCLSAV